jgi:EAL domain-containing protein (putative c-di-GMP-specific phosphodiesterase class I)
MGVLLTDVLDEHGIEFRRRRNLFEVTGPGERTRLVSLLRQVLSEPERQAVSVLNGPLAGALGKDTGDFPRAQPIDEWWRIHQTDWFSEALAKDRFEIWFQPIVNTAVEARPDRLLAHECLIRLNAGRMHNGGEIVDAARTRNEIHAFDSYARSLSIRSAARQSPLYTGKFFVNFMPSSIYNPEFCMKSTMATLAESGLTPRDIVFEVVESDRVRDPSHLRRICDYYRRHGFAFALDDVGTGANSLQMVCDLRPDYIKLDKSLISNIEQPMYAATIRKLVELAAQFGVLVIAEGVEQVQTMENLWLLGVQYMQGYLFGRPAPRVTNPDATVPAIQPEPANAPPAAVSAFGPEPGTPLRTSYTRISGSP